MSKKILAQASTIAILCFALGSCTHVTSSTDSAQPAVFVDNLPTTSNELIELAEQGNADAQNRVGEMYHFAEGVKQDYQEAKKWYLKAVANCHPVAPNHLGRIYLHGEGVKYNPQEAMKWYLMSAERNDPAGQWNTAKGYYLGQGVQRDLKKAYLWFGIAAQHPDNGTTPLTLEGRMVADVARENQKTIAKWLKKAEIRQLDQAIKAWVPKPCKPQ